jgi:hypothetical protein
MKSLEAEFLHTIQLPRQKVPKSRLRYTSAAQDIAIEICRSLQRRDALQMRRSFGSYEPLGDTEPGAPYECHVAVAPWHRS